jgi:uncharacterized protein (DUF305 family)
MSKGRNTILSVMGAFVGIGWAASLAGCSNTSSPPNSATTATESSPSESEHAGHNMTSENKESKQDHTSHAMGSRGLDALKSLKGKEFDIAYLSQMIAHHEAAVQMANEALKGGTTEMSRNEAQKVITAQKKEIAQMTGWLREWYGIAPDTAQQALVKEDMKTMMAMPVNTDRVFFQMMIPHHQGAIDMSRLVPERSERTEVKNLATEIIAAQEQEIKRYQMHLGHL